MSKNKPIYLILSLFAIAAIVVMLSHVAKEDSATDQVYQESNIPVEYQEGQEQ